MPTTNFDPKAMGLIPLYEGKLDPNSGTGETQNWVQGEQTGWGKQEGNNYINWDMQGNETARGTNSAGGNTMFKTFLGGAAALLGGGLAMNALGTAATAATAGETFIPAADAFKAFEFSNMAATNAAFDAAAAGTTALETVTPLAETIGNVANTAQEAFRATELADAAAGINSAAGGALTSTTSGLSNVISNGIRNATSYISEALGIKDAGLVKDLGSILGVGGAGGTLFDYLMKGLQGGANNSAQIEIQNLKNQSALDVAKVNAQNNIDILNLKDTQAQAANKRFSESVSGINHGLISAPKPLTRNDGTRVFSGNGLINRG